MPNTGLYDTVLAASAIAGDVGSICSRRPMACTIAGETVSLIGLKIQTGVQIVQSTITGRPADTPEAPVMPQADSAPMLTASDLSIPWAAVPVARP